VISGRATDRMITFGRSSQANRDRLIAEAFRRSGVGAEIFRKAGLTTRKVRAEDPASDLGKASAILDPRDELRV